MKTLKTKLHRYRFNISKEDERKAYEILCDILKDRHWLNVLADPSKQPPAGPIELETKHLFANQWNSTTHRVFDWYEGIYPNEYIKEGHYLEITDEMREIRRDTFVCGYCGYQCHKDRANKFCEECLDSEYLQEDDLHLLRMLPVEQYHPTREPLSEEEKAFLMPLYIKRQTEGENSRNAKKLRRQREDIHKDFDKATYAATTKKNGLLWLMDHNISIDNVIYYDHKDVFCFGWRKPVSKEVASRLLDVLCEFPFDYEIEKEK